MMTTETIGVGAKEDFVVLEHLLDAERLDFSGYFEEYDPTPYNAVVRGQEGHILNVLERLDSKRIYYETTMRLPVV